MLVAISAVGSLLSMVVPPTIIGLMGVLPIAIGVKKLVEVRKKKKNEVSKQDLQSSYMSFLSVAVLLLQMVVIISVSILLCLPSTVV